MGRNRGVGVLNGSGRKEDGAVRREFDNFLQCMEDKMATLPIVKIAQGSKSAEAEREVPMVEMGG